MGGQERRYLELSTRLVKQGHEVYVLTLRHAKNLPKQEVINGVTTIRYAHVRNYTPPFGLKRNLYGVFKYAFASSLKVRDLGPFDVYIFNQWPLLYIPIVKPFCNSVTVIDWCEIWHWQPVRTLFKVVSLYSDAHTAVADFIKTELIDLFHVTEKPIEVIPSGVEVEKYRSGKKNREKGRIVFVGRLFPHKRVDLLIDAVKKAHKVNPEISLDVIGDGPLHGGLLEYAHGSKNFIKIHGYLPENEKMRILNEAWVFAITSQREGYPIAVVEAMASGLPIVTTDSRDNGVRNICDKFGCGIVVPSDPSTLADSLLELYENENMYKTLAGKAEAASELFDWDTVTLRLENFLKTIQN